MKVKSKHRRGRKHIKRGITKGYSPKKISRKDELV